MSIEMIRVWDLPTRLFHWTLVGLFLVAFAVAELANEKSPAFVVHMLLGLVLVGAVLLRIVWGFVGSRHARFRSFLFSPASLAGYLRDAFTGSDARYPGHNPGASYAIYLMLTVPLALAVSGVLAQTGGEIFEDLHGGLAWLMIVAVAVHLAGLAWHAIRHRENAALPMITGRKPGEAAQAIRSSHPLAGAAFALILIGWSAVVFRQHDPTAKVVRVPVLGVSIPVGEKSADGAGAPGHDDD
jgi:cytochrome b